MQRARAPRKKRGKRQRIASIDDGENERRTIFRFSIGKKRKKRRPRERGREGERQRESGKARALITSLNGSLARRSRCHRGRWWVPAVRQTRVRRRRRGWWWGWRNFSPVYSLSLFSIEVNHQLYVLENDSLLLLLLLLLRFFIPRRLVVVVVFLLI